MGGGFEERDNLLRSVESMIIPGKGKLCADLESVFLISREVALQDRYQEDSFSSCSQKDILLLPSNVTEEMLRKVRTVTPAGAW